jgi:hypothetical protein
MNIDLSASPMTSHRMGQIHPLSSVFICVHLCLDFLLTRAEMTISSAPDPPN